MAVRKEAVADFHTFMEEDKIGGSDWLTIVQSPKIKEIWADLSAHPYTSHLPRFSST